MLKRMEKAFSDKSFLEPDVIYSFETCEQRVNYCAVALVLICLNKLYSMMHDYAVLLRIKKV